jgi:hypothetical protein
MPDTLRTLVRKFDHDNARTHRLTGEAVMPPRSGSSTRRVCGSCWHVVDERAERKAWLAAIGCELDGVGEWPAIKCFPYLNGECHRHPWPGVTVCQRCGADALGEVVRG